MLNDVNGHVSVSSAELWQNLKQADADGNGQVSAAEIRQAADSDGDGQLSAAEKTSFQKRFDVFSAESVAVMQALESPAAQITFVLGKGAAQPQTLPEHTFPTVAAYEAFTDGPQYEALDKAARADRSQNGEFTFHANSYPISGGKVAESARLFVEVGGREITVDYSPKTDTLYLRSTDGKPVTDADRTAILRRMETQAIDHAGPRLPSMQPPDKERFYRGMFAAMQRQ